MVLFSMFLAKEYGFQSAIRLILNSEKNYQIPRTKLYCIFALHCIIEAIFFCST
ncbi:hypothetical protein [Blochmannia endosymbiont of Camponotus (Colobopsis) obliquus]|uniref:hypothetical protein n=1 Tax=Blochmannia endosymbiont of Camponotus (Colobopsis) obliquus TaxID=1505597 RepID=UPI00193ABA42|nr:hypothetical protein [Blochmannia endosymbiont of Camponotus (Colobopsis) obliquus]